MIRRRPSLPPQRGAVSDDPDDAGFTIIEVTVAIALITIVMTALAAFFVNSANATDNQGQRQLAVQIGTDAMERARSVSGVGLLHLRDKQSSDALWQQGLDTSAAAKFPGVAQYLQAGVSEAYDTTTGLAANAGYNAQLPTDGNPVVLDNITFTQNWFIGYCYANPQVSGGACSPSALQGYTQYYQVVVAVTWTSKACRNSLCSYVSVTRISPTPDPLFDANQSAPKPRITNPGNQVDDITQVQSLALQLSGGTAPVVWSATGLPPGLSLTTTATSASITGTTTAVTSTSVVVKVVDAFGFVSTARFSWTVNPLPNMANPGAQTSTAGGTVRLALTTTGGSPAITYSATGLPAGLSIDPASGVISGSPTTADAVGAAVQVTATDATGASDTESFVWKISPKLVVTTPGAQTANVNTPDTLAVNSTGGTPSNTWSATGLPAGLTINSTTGQISGTPTTTCTCSVKVTVTDSGGASTVTNAFTWTVYPALTVTTAATRSSAVNSAITAFTPTATGSGTYSWSATGLPTGIAINASSGQITGTPTRGGRYLTTITLLDTKTANSVSTTVVWTVTGGVTITLNASDNQTNSSTPPVAAITAYTPTATLNGSQASFSWSANSLPPGISIDGSSGKISGKPTTPGTYTVTITASTTKNGTTYVGNYMYTWTIT